MQPFLYFPGNFVQGYLSALHNQFFIYEDHGHFVIGTYLRSSVEVILGSFHGHIGHVNLAGVPVLQLFFCVVGHLVPVIYGIMAPVFTQD